MAKLSVKQMEFIKNLRKQGFSQKQINETIKSFEDQLPKDNRNFLTRFFDYVDNGPAEKVSQVLSGPVGDKLESFTNALPYGMAGTTAAFLGGPSLARAAQGAYNYATQPGSISSKQSPESTQLNQNLQNLSPETANQVEQLVNPQSQGGIMNALKGMNKEEWIKLGEVAPNLFKIFAPLASIPFIDNPFGKPGGYEKVSHYSPEDQAQINELERYSRSALMEHLKTDPLAQRKINQQQYQSGPSLYQKGMSYVPSMDSITGNRNLMAALSGLAGGGLGSLVGGNAGGLLGTTLGGYLGGYYNDFGKKQ